jgi:hypothetical protein
MPHAASVLALMVIAGLVAPVAAQTMPISPVGSTLPPEPVSTGMLPPEGSLNTTPVTSPPPILGAPVGPADRVPQNPGSIRTASGERNDLSVTPIPSNDYTPGGTRGAVLGIATSSPDPTPQYRVDNSASPQVTDPNEFLRQRSLQTSTSGPPSERSSDKFGGEFGEKLNDVLGKRNEWFKSDHAFDGFISPVTNPFLFEDPRSLTEVRPIVLVEKIPSGEPDFRGGNVVFFGTQLRLAITDRLSFVINKLGGESVNPGSGSEFSSDTGFAEFWFGPKYTFIRGEDTGTLLAGGLQFQVPTGNRSNFQDTGTLSLVPYVSFAQSFLRDFSAGSFNGMLGAGYSFSVNNERSDYFYLSAHLDMDVLNLHHFYPLLEMNWFAYTTNGRTLPIGIEGQDLINFGGQARGQGLLTGAVGGRYKINENYQVGAAFEIPFAGPKDLFDYRFTLDFIFRY